MIQIYVTHTSSYYQMADTPLYIQPKDSMLLVKLDYIAFYFPIVFFHKFNYIKSLLTTTMKVDSRQNIQVAPGKVVDMLDLSKDFVETAETARIDFSNFQVAMYHLLNGDEYKIKEYKKSYQPLIPFFNFVALDEKYLLLMK